MSHDDLVRTAENIGSDDRDLSVAIGAARSGDEDAFRALYRAVQPGLLRYLRVQVGEAAEDVASETWLQVARDLGAFSGDIGGFRGWVATIARHRALDHVRRQNRQPPSGGLVDEFSELPALDDTEASAIEALATDGALALIAKLPRDQGEAVLLRVVMGLDAKTAAKVLGKRPGAVRTAAYRGLRGLAARLEEGDGDVTDVQSGVTQTRASALKDMR
jgi:RNA polymerase sigma-70 factor, ECF subfamily